MPPSTGRFVGQSKVPAAPFASWKNDATGAGRNQRMTQVLDGDRDVPMFALQDSWLFDQRKLKEPLRSHYGSDLDDDLLDGRRWQFRSRVLDERDDIR